ncbi:GAF domain-containing protein [Aliifodinibius sp. S!AR15-10]|uniref:GAF domain-containing protein n=1 Tax=Aliifodinibius sp. S!AR15-10 TaxID=2950437 RepID=UPI00286540FC|nr:GAF domain-containing protein [Aliifodinibius sp. S!AR15-10]MDR8394492.1 GAF domain-containing protein [Aliifodinibius sp. S!AR15-10]
MSTTTVQNKEQIITKVDEILDRQVSRDEKLFAICELLDDDVDVFDWVGFYLVDPEAERELVLGPYVGEPTDHTRIPFGKGICGQAAESLETFVVQDVSKEDNYLACSIDVKAEIVVPILKDGTLLGELDIDSHTKGSITEDHRDMLEEICQKIVKEF